MYLADWFFDHKLSGWSGALALWDRRSVPLLFALRQEKGEQQRAEAARALRRRVLAAAITPVLRDLATTTRIRNGLPQTVSRTRPE
jgi:hypothetical protein